MESSDEDTALIDFDSHEDNRDSGKSSKMSQIHNEVFESEKSEDEPVKKDRARHKKILIKNKQEKSLVEVSDSEKSEDELVKKDRARDEKILIKNKQEKSLIEVSDSEKSEDVVVEKDTERDVDMFIKNKAALKKSNLPNLFDIGTNKEELLTVNRWFHPITENEASNILQQEIIKVGDFIVLPSDNKPNLFLFMVKTPEKYIVIEITCDPNECKYYIQGQRDGYFTSLAELIYNILIKRVTFKFDEKCEVIINKPLSCSIPVNEWYIPNKSSAECTKLLNEYPFSNVFAVWSESRIDYKIGIKTETSTKTFDIVNSEKGFTLDSISYFKTVSDLVTFYQTDPHSDITHQIFKSFPMPYRCSFFYASLLPSRCETQLLSLYSPDAPKGILEQEFEEIVKASKNYSFQYCNAQNPEYCARNRYKNILPYEHSRVKLKNVKCDYINANYFHTDDQTSKFILSQAPIDSTIKDHWNMIIQENVSVIVMLTNVEEKGVIKSSKYWPDPNSTFNLSENIAITNEKESEHGDITHRKFYITINGKASKRYSVYMFHYTAWPDFGIPEYPWGIIDTLSYCEKVKSLYENSSCLVHCSAGVGRTGVFVALSILFGKIKVDIRSVIDVKNTVLQLRKQRGNTVTTVQQYKFIYETLNKYIMWKLGPGNFKL